MAPGQRDHEGRVGGACPAALDEPDEQVRTVMSEQLRLVVDVFAVGKVGGYHSLLSLRSLFRATRWDEPSVWWAWAIRCFVSTSAARLAQLRRAGEGEARSCEVDAAAWGWPDQVASVAGVEATSVEDLVTAMSSPAQAVMGGGVGR